MSCLQYVIGDVHGEYDTLMALIDKLPKNHELIFLGDLIDRGPKSKEVIEYVKKNNWPCVLGNHEQLMIEYGKQLIQNFPKDYYSQYNTFRWLNNGGKQTLFSYDLAYVDKEDMKLMSTKNQAALYAFIEDINWLKGLPLYLELPIQKEGKDIVITHASCANVWKFHDDEKNKETFEEYALWNRKEPSKDTEIFNIYGHTPIQEVDLNQHFLNIDTGCTYGLENDLGELTAYCLQTEEIVQQKRIR